MTSGSTFSGNLSSISAIDDQRYRFFDDDVTLVGEVVVTGTSPLATPSSVKFVLVCSAGRSGLAVSIDLFNYTTNGFVNFAGAESFASDTKFELSTSSASYVKATTREMKARATWAPVNDEDPSQDGWLQLINMANWSVAP